MKFYFFDDKLDFRAAQIECDNHLITFPFVSIFWSCVVAFSSGALRTDLRTPSGYVQQR